MADEQTTTGATTEVAEPVHSGLRSWVELLALSSFAWAQPVLSTFGANPDALVTARASRLDLILFSAIVVLVLPTVLWLTEWVVGLFGATPRLWFHRIALGGLMALFLLQLLQAPVGRAPAVVLSVLLAVGGSVLLARSAKAQQFLRYLAFAPILFVVVFLFFSPAAKFMSSGDPEPAEYAADGDDPSVVLIVLDELPLGSLLDGEGNIDSDAYPGFAELAADSTLARNHTAASPTTPSAVPAVLTGQMPQSESDVAIARDHPQNLFTLLGDRYDMRAAEHVTHLCPESLCEVPMAPGTTAQGSLMALLEPAVKLPLNPTLSFDIAVEGIDPGARFAWLAEGFGREGEQPTLHFLHSMLPHQNWVHLPDGAEHDAPGVPVDMHAGRIPDDPAAAQVIRQRHLLQLAYADNLIAETIAELKASGEYDDSLVVVTADHGVSFQPDQPTRHLTEDNYPEVLWTPLFVKRPGQSEPAFIDTPTSSIDVVPTIADVLGVRTDWEFDGRSIFAEPRGDDWQPRSFHWKYDEVEPEDDGFSYFDGPSGYAQVIDSKAFDSNPDSDLRLWRWGEYRDLVGREAESFELADGAGVSVELKQADRFDSVDTSAEVLPSYVSGRIDGGRSAVVAVAVNGVIGGWYDMSGSEGDRRFFRVLVPPSLLRDGSNDLEVFLVEGEGEGDGDGDGVTLVPVAKVD